MSKTWLEAVTCQCRCRRPVLRVELENGEIATADPYRVNAAQELIAWSRGRASYSIQRDPKRLTLELKVRTTRDIKLRPLGYVRANVVLAHECRAADNPTNRTEPKG